ncbi:hypothetical protein [Conchiformibius kuhniae]|uniref:Alpha/beta hydrolase n=1 Tax=Conchiformibius kuhniae TaxID=211502 RepID=A0A8T9MXN9_9NEIS|nr:hypothetical protein [Conchiformibius kuhniae]UOP05186.1 hypothetical protein LVJ77_02775 [Conchiformibius kuhniae]
MYERETALLLLGDADDGQTWAAQWARGYPCAVHLDLARTPPDDTRADMAAFCAAHTCGRLAMAAHGAGVATLATWWARADWATRRRVAALIFVLPESPPDHTLFGSTRFSCRTAWIADARHIKAWQPTAQTAGARLFAPAPPDSPRASPQWTWGMRLLAQMLD